MPAEKIPSVIERLLLPRLSEISGDIKALNAKVDSTNERIGSLESKMDTRMGSMNEYIYNHIE